MSKDRTEYFKNKSGQWCFRGVSGGNNEIVGGGNTRGYSSKRRCKEGRQALIDALTSGVVVDK